MVEPSRGTPATGEPPVTFCYRHPLRETAIRCVRCNRPICPDCMRPASVGFQCPDDVRLGQATVRAPRTLAGARPGGSDRPLLTWSLIAVNVACYVATAVGSADGVNQNHTTRLFEDLQLQPIAVADHGEFYRLITSAFLHYGLLHLVLNMLALALVGPYLERLLGWWRYLSVYLLAALGGSVGVYLFGSALTPVVGASGAIFGLFAACLLLVKQLGLDLRTLVATIVLNFVFTFTVPDISKLGHVGGFVVGGLAALAITGLPNRRPTIVPTRVQAAGLGGLFVILLLLVVWRTAVLA
jgi:membrane associated rhomboid family serine protease